MPQNAQNVYVPHISAQAIEVAFAEGRFYIKVDPKPAKLNLWTAPFVGSGELPPDGSHEVRWVHVMDGHREIRGYALIDDSPILHLRLPAYPQEWHELDAAVAARLDVATANAKVPA